MDVLASWVVGWCAVNLLGYLVTWRDKAAARTGRSRVSESALLVLAVLGAGPGAWLAMRLHRHKTRKLRFLAPFALAATLGTAGWVIGVWWLSTGLVRP